MSGAVHRKGDRVRRKVDGLEGVVVEVRGALTTVSFTIGRRDMRLTFVPFELEPAPPLQASMELDA